MVGGINLVSNHKVSDIALLFHPQECNSKVVKVKKEALAVMGLLHVHLGPAFRPVVYAASGKDETLRSLLEKTFEEHPHDASSSTTEWPKTCICIGGDGGVEDGDANGNSGLQFDVPKMDLFSELPSDCIQRMVCTVKITQIFVAKTTSLLTESSLVWK
jgi:hypothetical protein